MSRGPLHDGDGSVASASRDGDPSTPPLAMCNACMSCSDCFPDVPMSAERRS